MRAGLFMALLLAGCATTPIASEADVEVPALVETVPVATANDAADDPAIWRNAAHPAASLIVATDKQAGIHVYDLEGRERSFTAAARLNNVDLREVGRRVIVAASDRSDEANAHIALFELDGAGATLRPLGRVAVGPGEAYGLCLWRRGGELFGFVVMKDGRIDQVAIDVARQTPTGRVVRSMKVPTQAEGCVVDDRTGKLYVAEEDAGLWRFSAAPERARAGELLVPVDGSRLVADAEGLALAPRGRRGGFLVASSQGDNAYALFRLPDLAFVGRFRIAAAGEVDATSETDGIEVALGNFGPSFPEGIVVAQDGDNSPMTQNFKLASWREVRWRLCGRRRTRCTLW